MYVHHANAVGLHHGADPVRDAEDCVVLIQYTMT